MPTTTRPAEAAIAMSDAASAQGKPTNSRSKRLLNGILTALIVVLFLIGAGFVLYPAYSNLYNEYLCARAAVEYDTTVNAIDEAARQQLLQEARDYNARHTLNVVLDPFEPGQEGVPTNEEYEALLNPLHDGMMGYLEIPAIGQKLPVFHGTSTKVLDRAVGHLQGTSLPVGGEGSHCVLSAHRGLPTMKLFTDLDQLQKGDQFYLHVLGEHLAYEVDSIKTVKPEESWGLALQPGQDLVTLVTCTPYGVNSHRLLVRGHRVDYVPHDVDTLAQRLAMFSPQTIAFAVVLSAVVIIAFVVFVRRLARKGEDKQ